MVRCGESHENDIDRLQKRLSLVPRARRGDGLGLHVRVSNAQVGGSACHCRMSLVDAYEVLIVGGGRAGQALAADLGLGAEAGEGTAVVHIAMLGKLPFTALRDAVLAQPHDGRRAELRLWRRLRTRLAHAGAVLREIERRWPKGFAVLQRFRRGSLGLMAAITVEPG